jgi:hypothetical protein
MREHALRTLKWTVKKKATRGVTGKGFMPLSGFPREGPRTQVTAARCAGV